MVHMEPLPLFYSLNRFLQHEGHIGAGSVEICRAEFLLDVLEVNLGMASQAKVEGKLDTCGSVSLSHSSHLQQVKSCRKYGLKEVVLTGIGGKSKPLREAAVLHVSAGDGKVKKILCYKLDERVGNTDKILLLSLRTIRDANIDILHHMDKSLDGISAPLLFLQDKNPSTIMKNRTAGKDRDARKFLMRQKGSGIAEMRALSYWRPTRRLLGNTLKEALRKRRPTHFTVYVRWMRRMNG